MPAVSAASKKRSVNTLFEVLFTLSIIYDAAEICTINLQSVSESSHRGYCLGLFSIRNLKTALKNGVKAIIAAIIYAHMSGKGRLRKLHKSLAVTFKHFSQNLKKRGLLTDIFGFNLLK